MIFPRKNEEKWQENTWERKYYPGAQNANLGIPKKMRTLILPA
jgi:hypothetical protein